MDNANDQFLKKLLATFRMEAAEHVEAMSAALLNLENGPAEEQQKEIIERIFREAHSLKGAARAVNRAEIESLCNSLESVFAGLQRKRLVVSPSLLDLVSESIDALGALLGAGVQDGSGEPLVTPLIQRLDQVAKGGAPAEVEVAARRERPETVHGDIGSAPAFAGTARDTIRVPVQKLGKVMRQTEELFVPRLAAIQRVVELKDIAGMLAAKRKERRRDPAVRHGIERSWAAAGINGRTSAQPEMAALLDRVAEDDGFLSIIEDRVTKLAEFAESDHRALSGIADNLLDDVREMQMLPFSSLLDGFPRLVRDLARDQGKQARLAISGAEIEIDRRILEEIKDPLIHLLRNSIDHGLEKPVERERKGKPPYGTLTIAVAHRDGSKVEIEVADDGAGIDPVRIKAAALRLGIASAEELETYDEKETLELIFRSGFSTSPIITDLSGRGLGLAIVREKVDRLGGTVAMKAPRETGTEVHIAIPLTLATFRGVLVREAGHLFIIPGTSVERVARVAPSEIRTVENRATIVVDGQAVALVGLREVLELPGRTSDATSAEVVMVRTGIDRIAFRVDAVLAEQQVVVKGLGGQLARVRNVAGATVLGTGQLVPVLNVSDLLRSAIRATVIRVAVTGEQEGERRKQTILVVEDSITSRALLKNILEGTGYEVSTAVDGIDAYTTLKTGAFDLIVSDVEMPRMDGFDLTAKIRADKELAEIPVVLVTALESPEHRERGIDAGANAYIVKSSFDQSNLLEVVGRLIRRSER